MFYDGKPVLKAYAISLIIWGIISLGTIIGLPFYILWIIGILNKNYRISNLMIDQKEGILFHKHNTLDLWRIKDIQFSQGIMDRIVKSGTIACLSIDKSTPKLVLQALPNAKEIYEKLKIAAFQQRAERKVTGIELS